MAATSKLVVAAVWLFLFNWITLLDASKLNVPRVLLPYSTTAVINFTLEVSEGGCYKWTSIRPEVVSVQMIDVNALRSCSTRAVVTAVTRHPMRQTSLILAQDDVTGLVLHCDVIVDVIFALEIVRTTAELYLDDAPEMIIARAKDKNGDTFSSLEGLVFKWSLITDTDLDDIVEASEVLRIIPFLKSKYDSPVSIKRLEDQGAQGYMLLLEGKTTGTAKITARLVDDMYKNILSEEVSLYVVANVILNPATDLYLLPGTQIKYKVERLQQGKAFLIEMPSEQFYLEVSEFNVIKLDSHTGEVTALNAGATTVILRDRNMRLWEPMRQPTSRIYVVLADRLAITVEPYGNWLLELGREYSLTIEAFDDRNNKIYPTDDLRISLLIPEDSIQLLYSTANGTYHSIIPMKVGTVPIAAILELHSKEMSHSHGSVSMKQIIEICESVRIQPELVVLPWDPTNKLLHTSTLMATGGGDDVYAWTSDNSTVVVINENGELTTFGAGIAQVSAASVRNPNLIGRALVMIIPVMDLHILASTYETEVDQTLLLHIALYGDSASYTEDNVAIRHGDADKIAFTDCRNLALKIEVADPKKFDSEIDISTLPTGEGCVILKMKAKTEGSSQVTVRYFNGETELKKAVVVASYRPLKALLVKEEIILALGSSKEVAFEGGPRAWVLKPEMHTKSVVVSNNSLATATLQDRVYCLSREAHIFTVTCQLSGRTTVKLKVGNKASSSLPKPIICNAEVTISCGIPASVSLKPIVKYPKYAPEACVTDTRRIPVQCYMNLELMVLTLDESGRPFDNVSSLAINWDISNPLLASRPDAVHLKTKWAQSTEPDCFQRSDYMYETVQFFGKEGSLRIRASIMGYQVDKSNNIVSVETAVSNFLDLELVDDAFLWPKKIMVFNHPDNIMNVTINKGSGQFDYLPKSSSVANVEYDENNRVIKIRPLLDGTFTLTVNDLCLETEEVPTVEIRVTGIKNIEVLMTDKVELNKEVEITVTLLDPEGQCLPVTISDLTNLQAVTGSSIISVKPKPVLSKDACLVLFLMQGVALGHTTLTFQATVMQIVGSDSVSTIVASDILSVQVFPPLRVHPCNLTLIIGAVFQITSSGGPQPQAHIEYFVNNSNLVTVTSSGLVTATSIGHSVVVARAIGVSHDSGSDVVYSQDESHIYIVELHAIRIHAPLTRMKSGTEMLVYPMGINEHEVPFSFGSARPPLLYEWVVSDKEIASIHPIYEGSGVVTDLKRSFVVRLIAKRPGQVSLSLRIYPEDKRSHNQIHVNKPLTDTLPIQIFEKLDFISPSLQSGSMLLTPNTEMQVQTNRDTFTRVSYQVASDGTKSDCLAVDSVGIVRTGQRQCQAAIIVTAHEEFGVNQSINLLVEVKSAAYLVLTSVTTLRTYPDPVTAFPVGGTVTLQLTLHDNVGNKFHVSSVHLNFRPNRFDNLEITPDIRNSTYTVKGLKAGQTVLKFWHSRNPRVETFVDFVTRDNIHPSHLHATLGDIICFSSPLLSPEGNRGSWQSNNRLVVGIDSQTGLAVLNTIGQATIYYEISPDFILRTEIHVSKVESISILPHTFRHMTNAWPQKTFDIPLLLSGLEKRSSNLIGKNCSNMVAIDKLHHPVPFVCGLAFTKTGLNVDALEAFDVEPMFDVASGQYMCRVKTIASSRVRSVLSTVSTDVEVHVEIPIQGSQPRVMSLKSVIDFLPAFHILVDDIQLSSIHPIAHVPISATDEVFRNLNVVPSDRNMLEVMPDLADPKSGHIRLYPIRLKEGCWEPGEVTLALDIGWDIGKVATVPIRVKLMEPVAGMCLQSHTPMGVWARYFDTKTENYKGAFLTILSIIGTGIAVLIGYWSMFGQNVTAPINPDAFAAQQSTRSYLFRPAGVLGSSPQPEHTPPGRTLLWSENPPPHLTPQMKSTPPTQYKSPSPNMDYLRTSRLQ